MILFLSINVISANEINENDINSIDSSNLVGVDSVDNTNQFSSNMDGESLQADNVQSNLLSSNMNGETLQRDNLQSNLSSEDNCIASNAVGSLENEDAVSNTDSSAKNEEITSNTDSSTNNEITSNVGSSANNDEIISNTASSVNINDKSVLGSDNNNTTASTLKENKATKVKTVFTISHTSVLKGTAVHIYLKDHEGNPIVGKKVTLVINKLTITETTNHLGEVSIKISDPVGTHSLKVHFEGDDEHLSHSDSFTLNVYMLKTKIYVHSTSVARGRYLYVYLKDKHGNAISGKKLTIKIKGKNYKVSTNKNGRAYLKISQGIGKYPVKVTFNGGKSDDYSSMSYYSSSKSFTLKVYKQSTKITVLSKTVVKGQYLIAYLKTSDGKALAKKRVLIRFNNIKYYRTTNKNGMAKLKIKKLGTFSLKISYSGSSYYKPSSRSFKGKCTIMPTKIVLQNSSVVRGKYLYAYLRDKDNKGIAKAKLIISFKGVKYTRTTNAISV